MTDLMASLTAALADRYRIERELGAGGMATVYLAHDLKHDRPVALKVLRQELAAALGAERFHREIQIAAKLQHPNILPLHDSGEAGGFLYYVMPFVEGHSLRERLAREGALPVGDVIRILRDVVDALTEAHAHGVVHRDIKPENIMLRGHHALVTDCGVAKAVSEATGRQTLTTAGVALGTPAYMAPEQASADPHLDHRVDIYAVGAVAYELLTGRPVFMGTTPQMVLAAHVTDAPAPITKYRETVPRALEALVLRCLEKKPADRWQSAEELLPQLEALATPSGGITPTETQPIAAHARRALPVRWRAAASALVVVAIAASVILALVWRGRGRRSAPTLSRLQLTTSGAASRPIISPDGSQIAYVAADCSGARGCSYQLVVRDLATEAEQPIVRDAAWVTPLRYSPDGSRILLWASLPSEGEGAFLISRIGGSVTRLSVPDSAGAVDFLPGGDTVLVQLGGELHSIPVAGGQAIQAVRLRRGVAGFLVGVSRDGRWLVFEGASNFHGAAPLVIADRGGRIVDSIPTPIFPGSARWGGPGTLLALQSNSTQGPEHALLRWRVSSRTGRAARPDTLLVFVGWDPPDVSADGRSLVLAALSSSVQELWTLVPSAGGVLHPIRKVVESTGGALDGRIAADGRTLVYRVQSTGPRGPMVRVLLEDFSGGSARPVTPLLPAAEAADFTFTGYADRIYASTRVREGRTRVVAYDVATGRPQPFADLPAGDITTWAMPRGGLYWHTANVDSVHVLDAAGRPVVSLPVPRPPGSFGGPLPGVSPDGTELVIEYPVLPTDQWSESGVAFYALSLADGRARFLARASTIGAWMPFWGDDGWIRVEMSTPADRRWAIYRVRATGGSLEREFAIPFERPGIFSVSRDGRRWVGIRDGTRSDVVLVRGFDQPPR